MSERANSERDLYRKGELEALDDLEDTLENEDLVQLIMEKENRKKQSIEKG